MNSHFTQPTVESLTDYYPFGMAMPGRSYNASPYRFGYTGHEKEGDLAEGVYTTQYRLLDTRLGRWMSVDPLFGKYPDMGAYKYCGGNPVGCWDPDGRELEFKHRVPDYDNYYGGEWKSGMGEKIKDRWEDFAKTKNGYEILAKFAKAGQSIGNVKFKEDGEYSMHKLRLYDYETYSSQAGACSMPHYDTKSGVLTFDITIGTFNSEERVDVTIGHEFFLHFDTYYEDYIKNSGTKEGRDNLKEKWNQDPKGDNDHKKYISDPKSFPKFRSYLKQLKENKDSKKVEEAQKDHDDYYGKKFKK